MHSEKRQMKKFPYITDYVNHVFELEKERFDYIFVRPVVIVLYFFVRLIVFPIKFLLHRVPFGFENYCIDSILSFGIKYFASHDAAELVVRHIQIEPLLYRFLVSSPPTTPATIKETYKQSSGIDGDFTVNSAQDVVDKKMTIAHDDLSYELVDRFDRKNFLDNLEHFRTSRPADHNDYGKGVLEENRKHSLQWFGCTNVVIFIVITITLFGDLRSVVRALNSFGSDSLLLWCLKHIYSGDEQVMIDLDFYMQVSSNRSHYNSSPFFSDPSQYLYYHIAFDEYAYQLLRGNSEKS